MSADAARVSSVVAAQVERTDDLLNRLLTQVNELRQLVRDRWRRRSRGMFSVFELLRDFSGAEARRHGPNRADVVPPTRTTHCLSAEDWIDGLASEWYKVPLIETKGGRRVSSPAHRRHPGSLGAADAGDYYRPA
jgi:hypothetical protein